MSKVRSLKSSIAWGQKTNASASKHFLDRIRRAERMFTLGANILITGPSGTGKSSLAKQIHAMSPRAKAALVCRGCGEFDRATLEATLFGHSDDAYTGAREEKDGLFQAADGGTLILDDIDYLPLEAQSRLLRFLDDGTFSPLGKFTTNKKVDVQIIVTSNKNLDDYAESGLFLPDLKYRLQQWCIVLPKLDERREDIPALAAGYYAQMHREYLTDQPMGWLSDEALDYLSTLRWEGNLRQLKDVVRSILVFAADDHQPISKADVMRVLLNEVGGLDRFTPDPLSEIKSEPERIFRTLIATQWQVSEAARRLGLSRNTIYRRIREYKWERPVE